MNMIPLYRLWAWCFTIFSLIAWCGTAVLLHVNGFEWRNPSQYFVFFYDLAGPTIAILSIRALRKNRQAK
jgi:hypothetical protein